MLFKDCERTDGRTDGQTDDNDDNGRWVITIPHLEPSAQVSLKQQQQKKNMGPNPAPSYLPKIKGAIPSPVIPDILAVVVSDWLDCSVWEQSAVTSQSGCITFPDWITGTCEYCCLPDCHWLVAPGSNAHLANEENLHLCTNLVLKIYRSKA